MTEQPGDLERELMRIAQEYLANSTNPDQIAEAPIQSKGAHFILGHDLLLEGKTEEARLQFEKALREHPCSPDVHYKLGQCYEREGDKSKALSHYEIAFQLSEEGVGFYKIALRHFVVKTMDQVRKLVFSGDGDIELGLRCLRRFGDYFPDKQYVVFQAIGTLLSKRGDKDEAITYYEMARRLNPDLNEQKKGT